MKTFILRYYALAFGFLSLSTLQSDLLVQGVPEQVCTLFPYAPDRHAVWFQELAGDDEVSFFFDDQGGKLTIFEDGSALVEGRIVRKDDSSWQWDVEMWLINRANWADWSAMGRTFKSSWGSEDAAQQNHPDWDYWELDPERSSLVGPPNTRFAGTTLMLSPRPSNSQVGFQLGIGANDKTPDFGLSGWFYYTGRYQGEGDINVNTSCEEVEEEPCTLRDLDFEAFCVNDSTFSITIDLSGNESDYIISDNQNTPPLTNQSDGTLDYGNYPSGTEVIITVRRENNPDCSVVSDPITIICEPAAPTCQLVDVLVTTNCDSDSTFIASVSILATGTDYLLFDDVGSDTLTGLDPGTYTFGPYPSETLVTFTAVQAGLDTCRKSSAPISRTCEPPPACDLAVVSAIPVCASDSSFTVELTFTGVGNRWRISDNQGSAILEGIEAGTYTFGNYLNNTVVALAISNMDNPSCGSIVPGLTENCAPPCDLSDLIVTTECTSDSTFSVTVSFEGQGLVYEISDNQGSEPLDSISGGTYIFNEYSNGTEVIITVSDTTTTTCKEVAAAVSEDCTPVLVCDLELASVVPICLDGQTLFEIEVTLGGTGTEYTLVDDQGLINLSGLSAGTYTMGPYPSNTNVLIRANDPNIPNCSAFQVVSTECIIPPPDEDLCENAKPIDCGDVINGRTEGATDIGACGFCGTKAEAAGVWYEFIGQGAEVTFEVCGNYDTRISVFESGCDSLVCVDGNDDAAILNCNTFSSSTTIFAEDGESYLIYVHGAPGEAGDFRLSVKCSQLLAAQVVLEAIARNEQVELQWDLKKYAVSQLKLLRSASGEEGKVIYEWDMADGALPKSFYTDQSLTGNTFYQYQLVYRLENQHDSQSQETQVWMAGKLGSQMGDFYPNPAQKFTRINVYNQKNGVGKWELIDAKGAVLHAAYLEMEAGSQAYKLKLPKLIEGIYLIRMYKENQWIGTKKLFIDY